MLPRLFTLIVLLLPICAVANDYLDQLVATAHEKGLANRLEWQNLLHYKPRTVFAGVESLADDPAFFNAPDGKRNPQAELDATLAAFFSTLPETDKQQNPQCRFIARYHWLKQELGFDPARLPPQPCKRFYDWRAALNPQSITLIFPAAYLNNPASLYGHTFLRVDARGQDERTRLLAYSISYAAATNDTNGVVFAVKGLFGGYPGLFSISPYYAKVTEYNDLENRDIWEYELNFTQDEIERMLMHVWELGPIRFDYYFFDENCAYHLLSLFDAARPSLRLTDRFPLWAIPSDTVRVVTEQSGLLKSAHYRPAYSTILRYRQQQMPESQVKLAKAVALDADGSHEQDLTALTPDQRARVLEVAFEYLEYERLRGRTPLGDRTSARLHELLLARSRMMVANAESPPAPAVRPDQGHKSARISVAAGQENGAAFQELRLRPVFHDLLDPEQGYVPGAQIEFVNTVLRHRQHDKLRLEQLDIVDIVSLSTRDDLLKPWSWKVNVGAERKQLASGERPLISRLKGGGGVAGEQRWSGIWYALLDGEFDVSGKLEDKYAVGAGPELGALIDITSRWRMQLEGRALRYALGDSHSSNEVAVNQRFTLGDNHALRVELSRKREFDRVTREAVLSWSLYF